MLVACSTTESFGLQVIEAISRGIPVVLSDIPAFREILGDKGLFFKVGNELELSIMIKKLLSSRDFYEEYSDYCYSRWKDFFENKKIISNYFYLYSNL